MITTLASFKMPIPSQARPKVGIRTPFIKRPQFGQQPKDSEESRLEKTLNLLEGLQKVLDHPTVKWVLNLLDLSNGLAEQITKLKNAIEELASINELTGAYNKQFYARKLKELTQRTKEKGRSFTILYIDLDHFKSVNDTYGHGIGDVVLKGVVKAMKRAVRESVWNGPELAREEDYVCRIGGEEFAILLPTTQNSEGGLKAAKRILRKIVNEHYMESCRTSKEEALMRQLLEARKITASMGLLHVSPQHPVFNNKLGTASEPSLALAHQVDLALYQAKQRGRKRIVEIIPAINNGEPQFKQMATIEEVLSELENPPSFG